MNYDRQEKKMLKQFLAQPSQINSSNRKKRI